MSNFKTTDLLYKSKAKSRLTGLNIGVSGPKGVKSACRHGVASTVASKFSAITLILDKIFIDKTVVIKQSDETVYVKFEDKGNVYEGVFDGDAVSWVGPEPDGYTNLIPLFAYALSNLNESEDAGELHGYFKDIKADPKNKDAIVLLCDAFYYSVAKLSKFATIESVGNDMPAETIHKGLENNVFKDIPLMEGLTSVSITAKVAETKFEDDDVEESYKVNYDGWTEEQKANITPESALQTFVMTDTALSIAKKIKYRMDKVAARMREGKTGVDAIGPDYVNLLMVGRPATGKTALANAVSAMTGMPIYTIPFSKHTEEDTAEGKNKVVNGSIGFVETDFLKAFENGGIVVLEEINLADPAVVMGSLGQAIEKPFIVMKDGYQPVKRHPMCVIIATMNTGTAGSKMLNQALSSRFKCTYVLDDPNKNAFINILAAQGYPKKNCKYVYEAYSKIIGYLKDPTQSREELCDNITLRGCFGALECMEEGQNCKEALKNSLVGKIAEVDLEAAKDVQDNVVENLPDIR